MPMSEVRPEVEPEHTVNEQLPVFAFGLAGGWGLMARQLEIEVEESFDGTRSIDKMLAKFLDVDPDETFRL
jgi:hypothetical protein